ncbi:MAG: hypothetical protein LBU34_13535 [Planctomycetaceae bacterium]|nr:hypothetical protein [Planctomycetaceae bacterium]
MDESPLPKNFHQRLSPIIAAALTDQKFSGNFVDGRKSKRHKIPLVPLIPCRRQADNTMFQQTVADLLMINF